MKMCEEMEKLRAELDKRGIKWEDKSSIVPDNVIQEMIRKGIDRQYADSTMFRTHFTVDDYHYSVIYGYGSYGGYDPLSGKSGELLECMTEKINGGEPVGNMTAVDVLRIFDKELDKMYEKVEAETYAKAESTIKHLILITNHRDIELSEVVKMFENKLEKLMYNCPKEQ